MLYLYRILVQPMKSIPYKTILELGESYFYKYFPYTLIKNESDEWISHNAIGEKIEGNLIINNLCVAYVRYFSLSKDMLLKNSVHQNYDSNNQLSIIKLYNDEPLESEKNWKIYLKRLNNLKKSCIFNI
jgi:hypothetical protein